MVEGFIVAIDRDIEPAQGRNNRQLVDTVGRVTRILHQRKGIGIMHSASCSISMLETYEAMLQSVNPTSSSLGQPLGAPYSQDSLILLNYNKNVEDVILTFEVWLERDEASWLLTPCHAHLIFQRFAYTLTS